jgi:HAD superfamily hydrolase (TIGR01509 family)
MTTPGALLLDLDGTLVDSEPLNVAALESFCSERGASLAAGESAYVVGHGWQEIYRELRLGERLGLGLAETIAGAAAARERLFGESFPLLPGVRELLTAARDAGIPTAIVTGSARVEADQVLRCLGDLAPRVSICSDEIPRGKPDPSGYLLAASRLGVAPERCLVVEDSAAGIAAGVAAGMRVVATACANPPPGAPGHQDQSLAHHRVASLIELKLSDLGEIHLTP